MLIETVRFGGIEIDDSRIIEFRDGVLGFPRHKRYALVQTNTDAVFFWLQSVDDPQLAFVVCDPLAFVPDFQCPIKEDDRAALNMRDERDCQVLVIVNKVDGHLTGNLLGPLVIGASSLIGRQMVLSDKRYSTRHALRVSRPEPLAMTA